MAKFKGQVSIGLVGCNRLFDFEIDDEDLEGMTENEIEEIAKEEMWDYVDWSYERVET